ncbi:hypothetical protein [Pseudomonas sp.]|uniref:hypothetical protein n=1 Tax=Pseudomonas sp. TaxID=306 RepID=UPI003D6EA5CA
MKINDVDFDAVIKEAIKAAKAATNASWPTLKDYVENIGHGIANDALFLKKKKDSGEFDEADARMFMEDQKIVARMRLRSLAIVTMKIAEDIINAITGVFKSAISTAIGWDVF